MFYFAKIHIISGMESFFYKIVWKNRMNVWRTVPVWQHHSWQTVIRIQVFYWYYAIGIIPNRSLDRRVYSFSLIHVSLCHISISFGILSTSLSRRSPLRLRQRCGQSARNKYQSGINPNDRFGLNAMSVAAPCCHVWKSLRPCGGQGGASTERLEMVVETEAEEVEMVGQWLSIEAGDTSEVTASALAFGGDTGNGVLVVVSWAGISNA